MNALLVALECCWHSKVDSGRCCLSPSPRREGSDIDTRCWYITRRTSANHWGCSWNTVLGHKPPKLILAEDACRMLAVGPVGQRAGNGQAGSGQAVGRQRTGSPADAAREEAFPDDPAPSEDEAGPSMHRLPEQPIQRCACEQPRPGVGPQKEYIGHYACRPVEAVYSSSGTLPGQDGSVLIGLPGSTRLHDERYTHLPPSPPPTPILGPAVHAFSDGWATRQPRLRRAQSSS